MKQLSLLLPLAFLTSLTACSPPASNNASSPDMSLPEQDMSPTIDMDRTPDMQMDMDTIQDATPDDDMPPSNWSASIADDAPDTLRESESTTINLDTTNIQNLSVVWEVSSRTADNVTCPDLVTESSAEHITLTLKPNEDVRCADELQVRATVVGDGVMVDVTHDLSVVPVDGRVTSFEQLPDNPQPQIQTCPEWDCLNHSDPTLGVLPSGELAIWFAAGGDESEMFPVVGRAVQSVDGTWSMDDAPVMTPADASDDAWAIARETPSVRWNADAEKWDMWYLGYRVGYHTDPAIGQARSMDAEGTQWARSESPIYKPTEGSWDETFLTSPGALMGSDGVWRLYYAGASTKTDAIGRIGVLTSTDGQTWTPYENNPVFEGSRGEWDANVLDPHVQFVGGRYVMWYSALDGQLKPESAISVGVAVSEDGYTWDRLTQAPIITPQEDSWTSARVLDVEVISREDGSLLMVGYAVSKEGTNPNFPDFKPGRIGLWSSSTNKE